MEIEEILEHILLLKNYDEVQEICRGYSGAKKYMVKADGKSYFLKIQNWPARENIENILQNAGVVHAHIFETGKIDNVFYLVEEFVEGEDFDKKFTDYSEEKIREIASSIGEKYGNFRSEFPDRKITKEEYVYIKKRVEKDLKGLKNFLPKDYFDKENLKLFKRMVKFAHHNLRGFKKCFISFCHNDIKPSNFIVNSKKEIVAVDCEEAHYTNIAFATRYGIITHNAEIFEKHIAFVEDFVEGYFKNNVPDYVFKDLFYFYVVMSLFSISNAVKYVNKEMVNKEFELLKSGKIGNHYLKDLIKK